jgi:hypothetical protein
VTPDPTPPAVPAVQDEPRHDVYVRLRDGEVAKTREPWEGVQVDLDAENGLVGFEFLAAQAVEIDGHLAVPHPEVARLQAIVDRIGYDPETDSWRLDDESREHVADLWEQVQAMQVSRDRYSEQVLAIAKALGLDRDSDGSGIIEAARLLRTEATEVAESSKALTVECDMHLRLRMEVEKILDDELGTEVDDGAGEGFVGDVALVVQRGREARAELAALRASTVAKPAPVCLECGRDASWGVEHIRYGGTERCAGSDESFESLATDLRAPTVGDAAPTRDVDQWGGANLAVCGDPTCRCAPIAAEVDDPAEVALIEHLLDDRDGRADPGTEEKR